MTEQTLARARAGDEDAFRELTDPYRRELQVHIYRILLQDTLLAAWRGLEQFEERASVRSWLYRIATNRSLDALRSRRRRHEDQGMTPMPEPTRWSEPVWITPYPDVLLEGVPDEAPGPEARYETKEAIGAFLRGAAQRRAAPLRLIPTRANTQPAFGCYLPLPETDIARAYALFVLTLERDRIAAITWFADSSIFGQFGLPRTLPRGER